MVDASPRPARAYGKAFSLASTKLLWWLLREKGIPNYMNLWGHDIAHDWPWWVRMNEHVMNTLLRG